MPQTANKTKSETALQTIAKDERAQQLEKFLRDDDDDDDDNFEQVDFLLKPRDDVGSSSDNAQKPSAPGKKNQATAAAASLKSEATRANAAATTSTSSDNSVLLEEKARQRVARDEDSLVVFHTKKIGNDAGKLFWQVVERRKKHKKTPKAYPCRICHPDESMHQSQAFCPDPNKTIVSFLGGGMRGAGQLEQVPNKQLVPLVDPVTGTILESHMTNFLNAIRSQKEYKNDPLKLLIQKCALEAIVKKCQEEAKRATSVSAAATAEGSAAVPVTPKQASPTAAAAALVSQEQHSDSHSNGSSSGEDCCDFEWGDVDDQDQPTRSRAASTTTNNNTNVDPPSITGQTKKQIIRKGCIIAYDQPLSVAGTDVRMSKVARVTNHRKSDFVLELEDGDPLQRDNRVKLVQKIHRNKLIDNTEHAIFQAVSEYKLINTKPEDDTVGVQESGIMKKAARLTKELDNFAKDLAANPETAMLVDILHPTGAGSQKKKNVSKRCRATLGPTNKTNESTAAIKTNTVPPAKAKRRRQSLGGGVGSKKATPSKSTSAYTASFSIITEAWWNKTTIAELTDKSNKIKATLLQDSSTTKPVSTRRTSRSRQTHHMSADQLDTAVKTRQSLETIILKEKSSGHSRSVDAILSEDIVTNAGTDVDGKKLFTLSQVQKFLSGDPDKLVSNWGLDLIHSELTDYLQKTVL